MPRESILLALLVALVALVAAPRAQAQSLWVEAGGVSWHADRSAGYRESNPALGLRWQITDDWSVQGVRYANSIHGYSTMLSARWTPLHYGPVRVGVIGGVVNGYGANDGGFVPIVLPTVAVQWGPVELGVIAWPSIEKRNVSGGAALAVSLRVW